jgi:WD40 repeat protein
VRPLPYFLGVLLTSIFAVTGIPLEISQPAVSPVGSVSPAPPMLQPRSGHTATLLPDGRVLVVGGMRRNQDFYRSAELYDPAANKFLPAGEMSVGRVGHVAILLKSGKVLIAGGWIGGGCTDSAELYDPSTKEFTPIAKMTMRRGNHIATLLADGDVLITGGADHDSPGGIASAEVFEAATLTFKAIENMHYARISHTSTLLKDGHVLLTGGRGDTVTASAELFDPKVRKFQLTGRLHVARYKHTAGLLPDGRVLIVGGSDARDWNGTLNSAEIYDPKAGRFSETDPLHDSRFKLPEEAVQLATGELLVAGGSKQVEIYDPKAEKFHVIPGQLSDAWHFMCETRLNDGSVLLTGGYPNNDRSTAETWIYRPQ